MKDDVAIIRVNICLACLECCKYHCADTNLHESGYANPFGGQQTV